MRLKAADRCATGKVQFRSRPQAEKAIGRARKLFGPDGPNRVYLCPTCGRWHLTGMKEKPKGL